MTSEEYLQRVSQLIDQGLEAEALEFVAQLGPRMQQNLTAEQLERLSGETEYAEMVVALTESARAGDNETASSPEPYSPAIQE